MLKVDKETGEREKVCVRHKVYIIIYKYIYIKRWDVRKGVNKIKKKNSKKIYYKKKKN